MIYAYCRVSTMTQVDRNGIQMQEVEIDNYCRREGITIDGKFIDEGISGTTSDREGLNEMIAMLEPGDKILVLNTSRLWRSDMVKAMLHFELRKLKVDVISIEQPSYSLYTCDPNDFLLNGMIELLDQYERMTIVLKLAKGRKAKAKTGQKPCGTAPYGYKWENNEIIIDYNNNLVVEDIYRAYIELKSLGKVKAYCDAKGYRTGQGKEFSKQSIANILDNDFYIGIVSYAGKKREGQHKPIISKEIFEQVQAIRGD